MREVYAYFWQAEAFLLLVIGLTICSADFAKFPAVLAYGVIALAPVGLSAACVRLRRFRLAALYSLLSACLCAAGVALLLYELLFVVAPANVGFAGLLVAYLAGALLWAAARSTHAATVALWRALPVRRRRERWRPALVLPAAFTVHGSPDHAEEIAS